MQANLRCIESIGKVFLKQGKHPGVRGLLQTFPLILHLPAGWEIGAHKLPLHFGDYSKPCGKDTLDYVRLCCCSKSVRLNN